MTPVQNELITNHPLYGFLGRRVDIDRGPTYIGPARYVTGWLDTIRYSTGTGWSGWLIRTSRPGRGDQHLQLPDGAAWQVRDALNDTITVGGSRTVPDFSPIADDPQPIRVDQLTPAILAEIQNDVDDAGQPLTVWPSEFFGPQYLGDACLVTTGAPDAAVPPGDAAGGSLPLLTVLPTGYFARRLVT